jgi:hypothetical protein
MVNPDDEMRRLDEALARLKAVADAEHHVHLEQMFSASQDHSWPPAPNTAHPSFERQAPFVRDMIARDECRVLLPAPGKPLWRLVTEPDTVPEMPPDPIVLDVRRCWSLAPWTERPYVYMWRVGVEASTNRWVAGDSWAEHPPPGQEWRAR